MIFNNISPHTIGNSSFWVTDIKIKTENNNKIKTENIKNNTTPENVNDN